MKKNFKSIFSSALTAIAAILAASAVVSCQDDNFAPNPNNDKNTPEAKTSTGEVTIKEGIDVYPLIYTMYTSDNDVEITSADTTTMSISSVLLSKKNIDLKVGNVISVWLDKQDLPFMRQITSVTNQGNAVKVTTKDIQASEIIEKASLEFDSEVYVDQFFNATNEDGSFNSKHFFNQDDGVYHPVAIFMHSEEEDANMEKVCKSEKQQFEANSNEGYLNADPYATNPNAVFGKAEKGTRRVYIIPDLENANFDFGVNISGSVKNICFPLVDEDENKNDTVAWFGIEEASASVSGGIHASLDIDWFSIEKFEIGPYYSISAKVKPTLNATKKLPSWKREYPILKAQGYTSVFWVGPIPVSISFKPGLYLGLEAGGKVSGSIGLEYSAKGSSHAYAVYENGGWHVDEGGEPFTQEIKPIFGGTISASAKAAVYFKGDVMVYGVAGPTLKVGPYIEASANASFDGAKGNVAAEAGLKFGVDATVGAKLEVWKWTLAQWNTTLKLYEKEIWKKSWSYTEWVENSKKVAEETGNITDDMEKIIKEQEEDEYIEDIIDSNVEYKYFTMYMNAAPSKKEDVARYIKDKYKDEWFSIEKNPHTFYDWDTEFQLWYGSKCDQKLLQITMGRMIEANLDKCEFLKNSRHSENVLRIKMENYIMTGDEQFCTYVNADQCEAVMKDWKNMRAEFVRLGTGGSKPTSAEVKAKFVNPWFERHNNK